MHHALYPFELKVFKMKKLRWSKWFSLGDLNRIDIPPLPGVYEIRWAIDGIPQPISRANRTDKSGCLYIGKSENLEDRLKKFRRGIQRATEGHANPNIHSGTLTYSYFEFQKKFKPKQLQGRYARLAMEEISEAETRLLLHYVRTYLDKPPLNISVKRPQ